MSCSASLYRQAMTFLSVPHEIVLLRHKVFREYAKIAVGPDFIHTLPSFLILTSTIIFLWKNTPLSNWLSQTINSVLLHRTLQVLVCCLLANVVLWFWLILQSTLYCCIWSYWSYESEYRGISYQWWQRVWSSYYPPPMQPPVMSAGFISWLISMSIAVIAMSCAYSTSVVWNFIEEFVIPIQDALVVVKSFGDWLLKRIHQTTSEIIVAVEKDEKSICDDCGSEISSDVKPRESRRVVNTILYGTNWVPKPNVSGYNEPQRKVSMHTVAIVNDDDPEKLSLRQFRHKRGCHTVIPRDSSEKSSGC